MATRRPLLLDVDTGVDDAMAIALASRLESHELVALTTVAGNVSLENVNRNSLQVLDWLRVDAPVYAGANGPLVRPLVSGAHVHGSSGLGGWEFRTSYRGLERNTAPQAIVSTAREHAGEIDLAFVGPLTNLAIALRLEPALPAMVHRLVIMGGAFFKPGNYTNHAEFNAFVDPDASAIVASSGFNATWVGLDVTHQTTLDRAAWGRLDGVTNESSVLVREVCRQAFDARGDDSVALHDPLAVASLEAPEILETRTGLVVVETGDLTRGRTRLAHPATQDEQQHVATNVDAARFAEIFSRLLT